MKAKIFITFALALLSTTESFARIMACDDSTGRRVLFLIEDYSLIPGKTSNIRVRISNSFRGNNSVTIPQGDYFASFKKINSDTLLVSVKNDKFYTGRQVTRGVYLHLNVANFSEPRNSIPMKMTVMTFMQGIGKMDLHKQNLICKQF
jgi:hypothetical protein